MTSAPSSELNRLLVHEIERRLPVLCSGAADSMTMRAALHSLKGSASLAGYFELALIISQLSVRLRDQNVFSVTDVQTFFSEVITRLKADLPPFATRWPVPPPRLVPSPIDARFRAEYQATVLDRVVELEEALSRQETSPVESLEAAQRHIHALKGAAAAVGDDVTTWYCHGLEAHLKAVPREKIPILRALGDLERHRAVLVLLIEDPAAAILRMQGAGRAESEARLRRRVSSAFEVEAGEAERTLKISSAVVEGFLDRLERLSWAKDEMLQAAATSRQLANQLKALRGELAESLRELGPPRPWGPSVQALGRLEESIQIAQMGASAVTRNVGVLQQNADFIGSRAAEMRAQLATLRRAPLSSIFERVERAIFRFAEAEQKQVIVSSVGTDIMIDRRLATSLYSIILQLARNAVAHGIETPERRTESGKAARGRITLRAERAGNWLRVNVEDDGQGVDIERIRSLAVARGKVSAETAAHANESELLTWLFLPGFTTEERASWVAGRGVGLDLVQDEARRLGGGVVLANRVSGGLLVRIEVPHDHTMMDVLWVEELGQTYAIPVGFTGKVELGGGAVRLARCLGKTAPGSAAYTLELLVQGVKAVKLGVDRIFGIEEVSIRALPPLIIASGPFSGVVLRGDGSLRLALDAPLLAARVTTLAAPGVA